MLHRALFGSMERFVAVLLEHCAGDFPLWLSIDQVAILPISDKYNDYAKNVLSLLNNSDIRGFVDDRNEKIGKKIREAELKKIPFMLIVGEKEADNNEVSVRQRLEGDLGSLSIENFKNLVEKTINKELLVNAQ
jgi:threonyl-tRNA synthetase